MENQLKRRLRKWAKACRLAAYQPGLTVATGQPSGFTQPYIIKVSKGLTGVNSSLKPK